MTELYRIGENIYRIKHWNGEKQHEPLVSKYGLISYNIPGEDYQIIRVDDGNTVTLENGYQLTFTLDADYKGAFDIRLKIDSDERFFGLGGGGENPFQKRGCSIEVKQNVSNGNYGIIPYLMSSRGWAIITNCSFAHTYDIASTEADTLHIYGDKGGLDVIVFLGKDIPEALYLAGKVTGRPVMLPRQAYGVTMVHSIYADARSLLDDGLRCKDRDLPCDYFGLEPNWMSVNYDTSTEKKWNYEKFPAHAYYCPVDDKCNDLSFIWNLNQMGLGLGLWLCNEYDLFWKEENDAYAKNPVAFADGVFKDPHLAAERRADPITKPGEAWFDHLKKFVNNGAEAFKLDAAFQVMPHPDRIWGGRYTEEEIRNIYPVVYAKQMKEGYQEHTKGQRPMINTCGLYLGTQKYAATWAGDVGSSIKVLQNLRDMSMCGHSNTSFDFNYKLDAMHFGFLAPWTQYVTWSNWNQPWYAPDGTEEAYRFYGKLRSQLFPYLYYHAHVANTTSISMLRPLTLQYLETDRYDDIDNEYMLGDSLLVNVFTKDIVLPEEDEWFNFYDGVKHTGSKQFTFTPASELQGGGIYVRAGSIIIMKEPTRSLRFYRPGKFFVHVYPGKDTETYLYEDDGITFGYEQGEYAKTRLTLTDNVLRIHSRIGSYTDMPDTIHFDVVYHNDDGTTVLYDADKYMNENGIVEIVF